MSLRVRTLEFEPLLRQALFEHDVAHYDEGNDGPQHRRTASRIAALRGMKERANRELALCAKGRS